MASAENLLISAVITNKTKRPLDKAGFTPDNMARHSEKLFFITQSKKIPSRKAFKARFPTFALQKVPNSDFDNLIEQCKENKQASDVSQLLNRAATMMQNSESPSKVVALLVSESSKIGTQFDSSSDIEVMSQMDMLFRRFLQKRSKVEEGATIGIPYGFKTLDRMTGGMQPKELITIAARTKIGKSWIMCKFAAHGLLAGDSVLYLSLEMDWDAIANRIFAVISNEIAKTKAKKDVFILKNHEMNMGQLSEKKVAKVLKEIRSMIKGELHVPEMRNKFSVYQSAQKIELLEPDVCYFDYFGLTQQASGTKGVENWTQAADASRRCKEIARMYDIPYVLGAQVNRSGAQADSPKLEHISLTDSIGQDSDKVFMLRSPGKRERLQFICEKFRGNIDGWRLNLDFFPNDGLIIEKSASGFDDDWDEFNEEEGDGD